MCLFFVGTAGCGKTTACGSFSAFLTERNIEHAVINLDPGAIHLPYNCELDVREWIDINAIMEEHQLGPNGAQVLAADLVAMDAKKLAGFVDERASPLYLFDTPGQLELFAFRPSSKHLVETIGRDNTLMSFLHDAVISRDARNFISQMMLYHSAELRLQTAGIHLLSKSDLVDEKTVERILSWTNNPEIMDSQLEDVADDPTYPLARQMLSAMEMGMVSASLIPWSAYDHSGMEKMLSLIENIAGWDSEDSF